MRARFHGTFQQLKDLLLPLDLDGDWQEQPNGIWKLRCRNRAGLLWSETKGTVWFDGPPATKDALAAKVEAVLSGDETAAAAPPDSTIFVVHGRDHDTRDQLELVLRRLGLEPFVLQVTGGGGDTLIEALERMIGKSAQSSFGIVLVTPDDMGYLKNREARRRQASRPPERNYGNGDAARVPDQEAMRYFAEGICGTPLEYWRGYYPSVQRSRARSGAETGAETSGRGVQTWTLERSVGRRAERRKPAIPPTWVGLNLKDLGVVTSIRLGRPV